MLLQIETETYWERSNYEKKVFKQENMIFGEDNIEKMFDYFWRNNFRENPICEYVLDWKKQKQ